MERLASATGSSGRKCNGDPAAAKGGSRTHRQWSSCCVCVAEKLGDISVKSSEKSEYGRGQTEAIYVWAIYTSIWIHTHADVYPYQTFLAIAPIQRCIYNGRGRCKKMNIAPRQQQQQSSSQPKYIQERIYYTAISPAVFSSRHNQHRRDYHLYLYPLFSSTSSSSSPSAIDAHR